MRQNIKVLGDLIGASREPMNCSIFSVTANVEMLKEQLGFMWHKANGQWEYYMVEEISALNMLHSYSIFLFIQLFLPDSIAMQIKQKF